MQPDESAQPWEIGHLFAEVSHNGALPFAPADGPAWAGRGVNARVSATARARRGALRVRAAPLLWSAQNAPFTLVPTTGPFPFSDAALPRTIDLPQRHGDRSVTRLDAGESEIALEWTRARIALTNAAVHLGPATDHSLVMQGDGGGFPRLEVGLPDVVRTPVGVFSAQVAWGRNPQTAWAPDRRRGALFSSYVVGTWRPRRSDRIELGVTRFFHRDWQNVSVRELFVPFGSIHTSRLIGGTVRADNQMGSIFARLRAPAAGLEFFGEYGKNDRSIDPRDQVVETEHNAAWLLGFQRVWRGAGERLWVLNVTAVTGSISPITTFRGQAFFYEHSQLTQGHTVRGQLLGTPLLQREGGGELRLDRYDVRGRDGLVLRTRALPNEHALGVDPSLVRQEWSVLLERLRWTSRGAVSARVGAVADLGYSPVTGDAYSVHTGLSYAWGKVKTAQR